ncbi:MAG TPA: hypothetical protein V6D00_01735 [Pantanalinema sp.]
MPNPIQRTPLAAKPARPALPGAGLALGLFDKPKVSAQDTVTRSADPQVRPSAGMTPGQAGIYYSYTDAQRKQFDQVWSAVEPSGQKALIRLLEDGRLLSSKDMRKGDRLLTHLDRLSTQALPAGLSRAELLGGLITQAQDPGTISQGDRGTCTVTTAEYMLASKSPAEYARVVSDLSTTGGQVTLASGAKAHRIASSLKTDDSGRTSASRLFEAAMMEYGNGPLSYSNETDKHGIAGASFLSGGLTPLSTTRVLSAALGEDYDTRTTLLGRDRLMRSLKDALAEGQTVPIGMDWRGSTEKKRSGHEVLVLKIEDDRVYYRNPWGQTHSPGFETDGKTSPKRRIEDQSGVESMALSEFRWRLDSISRK